MPRKLFVAGISIVQEVLGFVKENRSEAQRRKYATGGERGAGKGAAALVPAQYWRNTERDQRSVLPRGRSYPGQQARTRSGFATTPLVATSRNLQRLYDEFMFAPSLLAIAMLVSVTSYGTATPRPIVLTTDCGADMDDQWALAHLVLTPEFDVRAVVTTHTGKYPILAAPAAETSARIAREVLDHMPLRSRPVVIPGSSIALPTRTAIRSAGVERIISESRTFNRGRRLTVLVIGAATDTASALLTDRSLANRIEIIAMGFDEWPKGGDIFNIANDPIAWQVILDSGVPVTVGDSTVTKRDLSLTSERAHAILDPTGGPGRYLAGLLDEWLAKHRDMVAQVTGDEKRWPVWDEVTVAHLLGMTKAERHARPRLRADLSFDHSAKHGTITWVTAIEGERLWADLAHRLQQAQIVRASNASSAPEFRLAATLVPASPQP